MAQVAKTWTASPYFRLSFEFSCATSSYASYIVLPVSIFESTPNSANIGALDQVGLASVPVDKTFCWSLSPSVESSSAHFRNIEIEHYSMSCDESAGIFAGDFLFD